MFKKSMDELQRMTVAEFKDAVKTPIAVVLENVRSMHNVGSVFRTADAFRIEKIYLCGYTPLPPHRDIHKTALGSTESVIWEGFENPAEAITLLRNQGYKIYAIEQVHNSIFLDKLEVNVNEKIALIFGNEADGVSEELIELSDACIEIPQAGSKHSFNISVAAGIVLWHLYNKIKL
jgi:23S rRNA (guanosine2251-2'-O)-methyltransferase